MTPNKMGNKYLSENTTNTTTVRKTQNKTYLKSKLRFLWCVEIRFGGFTLPGTPAGAKLRFGRPCTEGIE